MGQIERIGDQPERPQISRRFRRSGAGSLLPVFVRGEANEQHRRSPDEDRQEDRFIRNGGYGFHKEIGEVVDFGTPGEASHGHRDPFESRQCSIRRHEQPNPECEEAAMVQHPCCARHAEHHDHPIEHVGF